MVADEPFVSERDRIIDRGPAWMIAFCAFLFISSHHGIVNCGALFYPGLIETTGLPISVIAWAISGQFGVSYLFAPLYNRVLDYVSTRSATILAILVTMAGMIIAAFSQNFIMFLVGYTIIAGIGMGVAMVRVIATMADYFDYYRILALALCSSGSGFGTIIYSILGRYFIEQYTWRIAMVGFAIVHMHTIALCLLLRPIKEDPVSEPVIVDSNAVNQKTLPENISTSFMSRLSLASIHTSICGSQMRLGSRTHISPQDLGVFIEYVRLTGQKFCFSEESQSFWKVDIDPINFLTDLGRNLTEQLKQIARNRWSNSDRATQHTQNQNLHTLLIPLIFLIPASDSELELQTMQDLMLDKIHSNPNLLIGSSLQFGPNDPKPKSCMIIGDSLSASILNARDLQKSHAKVHQVVRKALLKVKQINKDLTDKGSQTSDDPVLIILDQDDYFMKSKLTNYGADERLCVLGYNAPDELATLEEKEDPNIANLDEDTRTGLGTVQSIPRSTGSGGMRYARSRRVSSNVGISNPYLIKALAKQYIDSQSQPDQILLGSRSTGINLKLGSNIFRSRDLPIRPSRLSIIAVDKPEEAVQLLVAKLKADENEEPEPMELTRCSSTVSCKNALYVTLLISRMLIYLVDSIVFSHLMNFALTIGISQQIATSLFGYIGISGMIARLCTGFLGQFAENIKTQAICAPSALLLGTFTIIMPFIPSYGTLAAYGILYSTLVAPSFAFANAMVIEIMGTEKLDRNLSYLLLMEAFGSMAGAPLGGVFKEIRESYVDCFAFGGVCVLLSGSIILIHGIVRMDCVQNKLETLSINGHQSKSRKQPEVDSVLSATESQSNWHSKSSGIDHVTNV